MPAAVAEALGKQLIEIETNVRDVCRHFGTRTTAWGPALACAALLLQDRLDRILVGATDTYATLIPWGTHPLLDPLFGTEALEIVHDGCEATRVEKLERIAALQVALAPPGLPRAGGRDELRSLREVHAHDDHAAPPRRARRSGTFPVPWTHARSRASGCRRTIRCCSRRQNIRLAREVGDWPVYAALSWTLHTRSKVHGPLRGPLRRTLGLADR